MNLKELYQEIILDHGKNPRNLRKTENFNKDAKGHNPLCGDKVHVYLKLNENRLPRPFTNMPVLGRILLVRMDEYSEPQDFTIKEYHRMTKNTQPRTRSSSKLISRPLSRNVSYSSQDCL